MSKTVLRILGFGDAIELIESGRCPFCKEKIRVKDFRTALSVMEFQISGLCQKCQDGTFDNEDNSVLQNNEVCGNTHSNEDFSGRHRSHGKRL